MRIVEIQIEGVTAYSQSKLVDPDLFPRKEKEGHDEYDKRVWREKSTFNAKGEVCIPAMSLKMATDEAIKRLSLSIPGRKSTTYTKFFLAGQICEADVPIGVMKADLEYVDIWANADGIRGSNKRVRRRFPYIPHWSGVARFAILDDVIPSAIFERAFVEAGRLIGIGRFRPEKGGYLGRYAVGKFKWSEV